jgi:sugar phosphate isomerase/epimerase
MDTGSSSTRRGFLATASLFAGGALIGAAGAEDDEKETEGVTLKLASQDGRIPGDSLKEKVERMADWGFVGLEVGGGGLADRVEEIEEALEDTPVGMAAICAGFSSCPAHHTAAGRKECMDSLRPILEAAGHLESPGVIVVPAFIGQTELGNWEAREVVVDFLKEAGEIAAKAGTRVLLEPLNRNETHLLRQLADAAAICRDVDHEGVAMMGDFYHMCIEETSDLGAFISAGPYLHHVHLASRRRVLPGQDDRSFVNGFTGLRWIGFEDYCSLECGCDGDPMKEIPKSVKFLKEQWEESGETSAPEEAAPKDDNPINRRGG